MVADDADADIATWHGHRAHVTLTNTATLTGDVTHDPGGLVRVTLRGGADILLEPATIAHMAPSQEAPSPNGKHQLAAYLDVITDADWRRGVAVHEAAHAVIAACVGLTVVRVRITPDRTQMHGGRAEITSDDQDAQAIAVHLVAGPLSHIQYLTRRGYGPLTAAAVEQLSGQGDHRALTDLAERGFIVYHRQALADAETLLAQPRVARAVTRLAEELLTRDTGVMEAADLTTIMGTPADLTTHPIWTPTGG